MNYKSLIEEINTLWNNALNSGNVEALAKLYTENALLSPGNGKTLIGRAEIQNLFSSFVEVGVHNHKLDIIESGGSDNMVYQVARWSAQGAETNGDIPTFGGITTSLLEQNSTGSWLTRSHVWNINQ